ncbi:MAG: sugar ABC transporter permease [Fusobacteriia bacterium 4572_74]|nr:MAG: sugar ABC transporter permease [Fusobacteriia bacterium 4572_74]
MNKIKLNKKIFTDQIFILAILILIMGVVVTIFNPAFLSIKNILNVLQQISVFSIVAAGATLVMISGNFDISVGSMIGLATTTMAMLISRGNNVYLSIIFGLLICLFCGFLNGVIIAKTRTPSFIITLALLSLYHGISLVITRGMTHSLGGKFSTLGRGLSFGIIPNPIIIALGVYIFLYILLRYTKFGRRIYAIGNNEEAAYLSGVNIDNTKILNFALNGLLVGIASIVLLSRLGAALPSTGTGMELRAIAAVVVGGVSLSGGKGSALGTFLGVVLMGLISNVLNLINISAYYQEIVIGIIIIVAVVISNIENLKRK